MFPDSKAIFFGVYSVLSAGGIDSLPIRYGLPDPEDNSEAWKVPRIILGAWQMTRQRENARWYPPAFVVSGDDFSQFLDMC